MPTTNRSIPPEPFQPLEEFFPMVGNALIVEKIGFHAEKEDVRRSADHGLLRLVLELANDFLAGHAFGEGKQCSRHRDLRLLFRLRFSHSDSLVTLGGAPRQPKRCDLPGTKKRRPTRSALAIQNDQI